MARDDDDDLAELALNLRAQITEAGLRVSPVAPSSHRSPDVFFVHPDVPVDELVEMLVGLQPALVFVTAEPFDQDEVDSEDERIRASATSPRERARRRHEIVSGGQRRVGPEEKRTDIRVLHEHGIRFVHDERDHPRLTADHPCNSPSQDDLNRVSDALDLLGSLR